jgi:hypothetical protein
MGQETRFPLARLFLWLDANHDTVSKARLSWQQRFLRCFDAVRAFFQPGLRANQNLIAGTESLRFLSNSAMLVFAASFLLMMLWPENSNDRRLLNSISYNLIIMRTSPTASSRAQPRRCIVVQIVQQQTGIVDMEIIKNDGQKFRRLFIIMNSISYILIIM